MGGAQDIKRDWDARCCSDGEVIWERSGRDAHEDGLFWVPSGGLLLVVRQAWVHSPGMLADMSSDDIKRETKPRDPICSERPSCWSPRLTS